MATVDTIKVKHKGGYMLINKDQFDANQHEEYKETNQDLFKMNKDEVAQSDIQQEQPAQEQEAVEQPNRRQKARKVKNADNSKKQ
jgi:hypothetical protein